MSSYSNKVLYYYVSRSTQGCSIMQLMYFMFQIKVSKKRELKQLIHSPNIGLVPIFWQVLCHARWLWEKKNRFYLQGNSDAEETRLVHTLIQNFRPSVKKIFGINSIKNYFVRLQKGSNYGLVSSFQKILLILFRFVLY